MASHLGPAFISAANSLKHLGWFNVKDYGAIGDNVVNDTAAINLAIAALNAAGSGHLYFPAGAYKTTAALTTITVVCEVSGDGGSSYILAATSNINILTLSYPYYSVVRDLIIVANSGAQTSGAAILLNPTVDSYHPLMYNVRIVGTYHGIQANDHVVYLVVDSCYMTNIYQYGVFRPYNGVNPDFGDDVITNSHFATAVGIAVTSAGIAYQGHGGPKISNNKFQGNSAIGVDIQVADGVATIIGAIVGNSFDATMTYGVRIGRPAGGTTGTWGYFAISGNVFSGVTTSVQLPTAGISNVEITGNTIYSAPSIFAGLTNIHIGDNTGYNPVGILGPPGVPATTVSLTSPYYVDCTVYVTANAGFNCAVAVGGSALMTIPVADTGSVHVPAGKTIKLTYGGAPTWAWYGH